MASEAENMTGLINDVARLAVQKNNANTTDTSAATSWVQWSLSPVRRLVGWLPGYRTAAQSSAASPGSDAAAPIYFNVVVYKAGAIQGSTSVKLKDARTPSLLVGAVARELRRSITVADVDVYEAEPGWNEDKGIDPSWKPLKPTERLATRADKTLFIVGLRGAAEKFMDALPRAKLTQLADGCALLTLPNGADGKPINWPGLKSPDLFIRPCFVDFYENPAHLNKFELDASVSWWFDTLLRGVPGIGKSSFGLYVLWRLVTEGQSVIYDYPRGVAHGAQLLFGVQPFAAYIVDGVAARIPDVPTLMISSPRGGGSSADKAAIYDEFMKRPCVKYLYMPKPTTTELHLLRTSCFPAVSAETVSALAERCGNRPRQVLAHASNADEELERAIGATRASALRNLVQTLSEQDAVNDATFRIVDYVISRDYTKATFG